MEGRLGPGVGEDDKDGFIFCFGVCCNNSTSGSRDVSGVSGVLGRVCTPVADETRLFRTIAEFEGPETDDGDGDLEEEVADEKSF